MISATVSPAWGPELFFDPQVNEEISAFVRDKIRARIKDPKVAKKLIPTTYGFGTKRVPLETNYFEAFNRENVELVDVNETPIERLTERGVRTAERCPAGADGGAAAPNRAGQAPWQQIRSSARSTLRDQPLAACSRP